MRGKVSLKWQYWFNYLSVALTACIVVGLTLYLYSIHQLNRSVNEAVSVELSTAASYLEEQTGVLQDIAMRVSNSAVFQRRNRDNGVVAQYEIVNQLSQFKNYTPLAEQLFLYYRDESKVWKPGFVNSYAYYAELALRADDAQEMLDFLSSIAQTDVYAVNRDNILLAVPMYIDVNRRETPDGVMGFVIQRSLFYQQLAAYAPGLSETVHLFFGSKPLFDADESYLSMPFETDKQGIERNGDFVSVRSSSGLFRLVIDINDSPMYDCVNSTARINMTIVILALVAMTCFCYLLALRSWRPVRRILDKHQDEESAASELSVNELTEIDKLLTKSNLSEAMLNEQTQKLRHKQGMLTRQFFMHLLNGNLTGNLENRAEELGIRLTGTLFQTIAFSFPAAEIPDEYLFSVEDLSDSRISFFCVPFSAFGECAVIVNAENVDELAEGKELLLALNDAYDPRIVMQRQGDMRENLAELIGTLPSSEVRLMTEKLREAVANGKPDDAMELYASLQRRCVGLPVAQQHFIATELILKMMNDPQLASEESFAVATRLISENQQLPSSEAFREWIGLLCRQQNLREREDNGLLAQIVQYVDEHLDDFDLDNNGIAEALSVSSKSVREAIRDVSGLSSREYFNKRRVEKARQMLKETRLTVSEISQAVGYRSVSYFIKNFRMAVGETPNAYREKHDKARNEKS